MGGEFGAGFARIPGGDSSTRVLPTLSLIHPSGTIRKDVFKETSALMLIRRIALGSPFCVAAH